MTIWETVKWEYRNARWQIRLWWPLRFNYTPREFYIGFKYWFFNMGSTRASYYITFCGWSVEFKHGFFHTAEGRVSFLKVVTLIVSLYLIYAAGVIATLNLKGLLN